MAASAHSLASTLQSDISAYNNKHNNKVFTMRPRRRMEGGKKAAMGASWASVDFYKRVDTAALVVFALAFTMFNATYWNKYWV